MFTIHILLPFRPSIQFSLNQPVNLFNLRTLIFNKTNIPINSQLIVYNNKPLPHYFIIDSNITLVVINKNNYGYISPSDFNLFAEQAQLDIFEDYFYLYNNQLNAEVMRKSGTGYANITKGIVEVIESFQLIDLIKLLTSYLLLKKKLAGCQTQVKILSKLMRLL